MLLFFLHQVDEIPEVSVVGVNSKQCFSQVVYESFVEVVDDVIFFVFFDVFEPLLKDVPLCENVIKYALGSVMV